jgi:hypothetical protein
MLNQFLVEEMGADQDCKLIIWAVHGIQTIDRNIIQAQDFSRKGEA